MSFRFANTVVSDDRWSCPRCGVTVVVTANPADTTWCLRAAQHRHGLLHANERKTA